MDTQWLLFCGVLVASALLSLVWRYFVFVQMRRVAIGPSVASLHPAELAYLFRPGDAAHCLIVLLVDTLQKELKSQKASEFQLSKLLYEAAVWQKVKDYIQDWSLQKAQQIVPEIVTKNPLKIASGVWRLRLWFWNALKGFFSDFIQDPLHVRKYFSPVGLIRLFVSIAGSGVKEQLSNDVRNTLLSKGLLVKEERRNFFARIFGVLASLHLIVVAIVISLFAGITRADTIAVFLAFCIVNGFILRLFSFLPSLLPHFDEVSRVLDSVGKKGIRISLMRGALGVVRGAYWSLVAVFSLLVAALQAALLGQFFGLHHANWGLNILGILALTFNFIVMIELCFRCFLVSNNEQLTEQGIVQLEQHHTELKKVKLMEVLSGAMTDPAYNEQLSDIVAIYGVETLFLV